MATKKLILDFISQPSEYDSLVYNIYINNVVLVYLNGENGISVSFKNAAGVDDIQIGATLNDTINNTLAFLMDREANFSGGGYMTAVSYVRIDDTIVVEIESSAPDDLICIFQLFSLNIGLRLITDAPCEYAYITNQSIGGSKANTIYTLPNVGYWLKNETLNTQISITSIRKFDTRILRGFNYSILRKSDLVNVLNFDLPASLEPSNIDAYSSGSNLYVNVNGVNALLLFQYSLDDITYQDESNFTDLAVGTYTVYVRDNLGCKKSVTVIHNGETNGNVTNPYTFISESNSIRYKEVVSWGNCGNYKTVFNTLSCEESTTPANKFTQLFQGCDVSIKTQVKTSYENVEVGAGNTQITANKIVSYIGKQVKQDCIYYSFNNQLAILFTTGNVYNYGTSTVIGTYELNGQLPDYGTVGTWVETAYGTLQIANIRLDDNGQRSLIFNINITIPTPINGTIQATYNQESYDIWEFEIDMSVFLNTAFNVGVKFYQTVPDANFPDVIWKSERIEVRERWKYSKEIVWKNTDNTDIYYYSGIEMKNRLNFCDVNTNLSDGDVQIEKTDSEVISIDATNYNAVEFEAHFLTTGMMRKIRLALKHNYLVIENVPYKLSESPETERQGKSNFYSIKAKLLEAGDVFNQGTANTQTVIQQVPMIGLLQGDLNAEYLRIK